MSRSLCLIAFLALALQFVLPPAAQACPSCKEAIAASDSDDDANNAPAAFNQSIYLMLAVPYASFGFIAFLIYRGCKKNAEYLAALDTAPR